MGTRLLYSTYMHKCKNDKLPMQACTRCGVRGRDQPFPLPSASVSLPLCLASPLLATLLPWLAILQLLAVTLQPVSVAGARKWKKQKKEELGKGDFIFFSKSFSYLFLLKKVEHELCLRVAWI